MYNSGVRRTQIYIDEPLDEQLRQRAAAEGRSAAAVIREALTLYLAADSKFGDDPIRDMAGSLHGLPSNASLEHDRDLYVAEQRSETRKAKHTR
jgi:plasmid stability protein